MSQFVPWSGPGVIQSFISIPKFSNISEEALLNFLDDVYVPGLVNTGIVTSAWRFKAANPEYAWQHMLLCKVPDLGPVQARKLEEVPRTSELLPGNGPVDDYVEWESRICSLVQLYETSTQPEETSTTIIYAAMEPRPGGEADLDAWYRDEHNQQMSEQPGWKRTTRYSLLFTHRNDANDVQRYSFLALHEFGAEHSLGKDVLPLDPISDWTKKCMSEAEAIDAAIFQKVKVFGAPS